MHTLGLCEIITDTGAWCTRASSTFMRAHVLTRRVITHGEDLSVVRECLKVDIGKE